MIIKEDDYLEHFGVKGMKWGVHKKDKSKSKLEYGRTHNRTLKSGTEIQNISRRKLDPNSKRSNRLYASYDPYDNLNYIDTMAGFQYNWHGYKNTFKVKKDIKIASEKEAVKTFQEMYKENPERLSKAMHTAYNATHFFSKNQKYFDKKLSNIVDNDKSYKIGRELMNHLPMTTKTADIMNDFYSRMLVKGFDAVLDTNDAYGMMKSKDPLIIFNMDKLGDHQTVKLTKKDIDDAFRITSKDKEFKKTSKDFSLVAR